MTMNSVVTVGKVRFGNALPLALIAGPCQLESREHAFMMAGRLLEICSRIGIGLVYKTSFDKANRTSLSGRRGMGLEKSLEIFADLRIKPLLHHRNGHKSLCKIVHTAIRKSLRKIKCTPFKIFIGLVLIFKNTKQTPNFLRSYSVATNHANIDIFVSKTNKILPRCFSAMTSNAAKNTYIPVTFTYFIKSF